MSDKGNQKELASITGGFYENLYSLSVFNEQIGQLAEEYDQSTRERLISELADLLGVPKETLDGDTPLKLHFKVKKEASVLPPLETQNETLHIAASESPTPERTASEQKAIPESPQENNSIEVEIPSEQKLIQLLKFLEKSKKYNPRQSKLLRQGALISLVSYFEFLIVDLLQFFYLTYPAALPSEGKLLSLADLREIGSVEDAERLLIVKEVDALLRDTTEAQIEYFSKRPKVDLKCIALYMEPLLEIVQRRNLFVHNGGVVNKIYLSKISNDYIEQHGIKEDDELEVEGKYLSEAIDTICICGTMLIQQSWRKWDNKHAEDAEEVLRVYIFDLLTEKRWNLAEKLAEYASGLNFISDVNARIITVNQAIALKEQNKIVEMEALLGKNDWSSCALRFHVALHALKEQYEKMAPLLEKAIAAGELHKEDIEEWPLFRWFRESNYYQPVLARLFSEQKADNTSSGKQLN